ncbi:MAG: hypothetical protein FWE23_01165 [Chitinivibrionia bacterium]|nr:hypothetical protein [Chitinivibrionia bacterium]
MEATLTLRADTSVLKPFEMMAKQFGVRVERTITPRSKCLTEKRFRCLNEEAQSIAQKTGLYPEDIAAMIVSAVIKECRQEKNTTSDIENFDNMCKEARKFAKNVELTQNDISDAIKKARAEKCA